MTREATPENTFVIGLAMAGAVSAGAYTAGVLDTLFRALALHEQRFQNHEVDHRVILKAMSGASAGSICAALGAASLVQGVEPHEPTRKFLPGLPLLHDLWVRRIGLLKKTGAGLLGKGDLLPDEDGTERLVTSLLDSTHIDDEALDLVRGIMRNADGATLGYVAEDLDIFLTTTNLMGVTYEVRFGGETIPGHVMASHGGVEHFRLQGLGGVPWRSPWLERWSDDGIALRPPAKGGGQVDFGDVFRTPTPSGWAKLVRTAVASGAFPIGLSSRRIDVPFNSLQSRAWAIDSDPHLRRPVPIAPIGLNESGGNVGYVAVDGGMANNEPFELARFAIRDTASGDDWKLADNPRDADAANRAVIMIDPFPEGPKMTLASDDADGRRRESGLLFAAKRLLPSLINQARFKPTELLKATDSSIHSRYLIAPSRTTPEGAKLRGAMAIASGFVGGFGGFFSTAFREHDYRLGQHNCRSFLEKYFTVAHNNKVLAGCSGLLPGRSAGSVRILQVGTGDLPDFVDAAGRFYPTPMPPDGVAPERGDRWPGLTLEEFDRGLTRAHDRIEEIGTPLMREIGLSTKAHRMIARRFWRGLPWLAGIGFDWAEGVRDKLSADLDSRILGDMVARNQLLASRYFEDDHDRALYCALVRHGKRPATVAEIAAKSTIFAPTVEHPDATITLNDAEVRERLAANKVRTWKNRAGWRLIRV